jgi:hypothetical protein
MLDLLGISENDVYISGWQCTIKNAKENPGTVYHYTTVDKWQKIQETSVLKQSRGTGLTNRSSYGIFTSVDSEEYAIGTYGDICLSLNLSQFKNDSNLNELELSPEPEVIENELRNATAHRLDIQKNFES